MSESVKMPALGESVTEGTVSRWLKKVGDYVNADDPLLEVSTDKVDSEVPAPVSGLVTEILVPEDETVAVGTVLCLIGENSDKKDSSLPIVEDPVSNIVSDDAVSSSISNTESVKKHTEDIENSTVSSKMEEVDSFVVKKVEDLVPPAIQLPDLNDEVPNNNFPENSYTPSVEVNLANDLQNANSLTYVTPIVRKMAKENNIDLSKIVGTGIGGRIRRKDVQDAIDMQRKLSELEDAKTSASNDSSNTANDNLRGTTIKMSRLRQVISRRMLESVQTSAQLTSVMEVDCSNIWAIREKSKDEFLAKEGVKLTFLPFFVKIVANALRNHPKLNASIIGDEIKYHDYEHIGIAVDTERGLLVPVIKDVNNLSTTGVAKSISDIASRARSNDLSPNELSGSTFTITNTGSGGTILDTPIINQPEVAILGIPKIVRRPVVVTDEFGNETIGIRPMIYLCLSYDHRLIDGADAARFLNEIKTNIESANISL